MQPWVVLATINLCAEFEISTLPHYKVMKGDKNVEIGVTYGLAVTQSYRQHNHSLECI